MAVATRERRDVNVRRRWVSAALASAALLLIPLCAWVLAPAPARSVRPAPSAPSEAAPAAAPPTRTAAHAAPETPAPAAAEAALDGDVADPDGRPVAGATVTCRVGDRELAAESDESGRFRLTGATAGCSAVARKRGFKPSEEEALRAGAGNRLRLGRATGIAGHVVDELGGPVPAFWIGFAGPTTTGGDAGATPPRSFEDLGGAFELTDLAPGRYELVATSIPVGPLVKTPPIEVRADTLTNDVRIALVPGVTVSGRVSDAATHAPLERATVFVLMGGLSTRQARTRAGEYTLDGAPTGPFVLRVTQAGYRPKLVSDLQGRPGVPLHVDLALERFLPETE